jgi:putative ABC transport system substrate-binding protein
MKALLLLIGFVFVSIHFAEAQQSKKIPRIGYLSPLDQSRESTRAEVIRHALRQLGYIEGQNVAIEYRYAQGKRDPFPELAAELVSLKVDVIVAAGGEPCPSRRQRHRPYLSFH